MKNTEKNSVCSELLTFLNTPNFISNQIYEFSQKLERSEKKSWNTKILVYCRRFISAAKRNNSMVEYLNSELFKYLKNVEIFIEKATDAGVLTVEENYILRLKYMQGNNLKTIAQKMSYSQSTVGGKHKRAIMSIVKALHRKSK